MVTFIWHTLAESPLELWRALNKQQPFRNSELVWSRSPAAVPCEMSPRASVFWLEDVRLLPWQEDFYCRMTVIESWPQTHHTEGEPTAALLHYPSPQPGICTFSWALLCGSTTQVDSNLHVGVMINGFNHLTMLITPRMHPKYQFNVEKKIDLHISTNICVWSINLDKLFFLYNFTKCLSVWVSSCGYIFLALYDVLDFTVGQRQTQITAALVLAKHSPAIHLTLWFLSD